MSDFNLFILTISTISIIAEIQKLNFGVKLHFRDM